MAVEDGDEEGVTGSDPQADRSGGKPRGKRDARTAEKNLSSQAIRALTAIILTSVLGIIVLSGWALALRAGIAGGGFEDDPLNAGTFDESLSILGNIAAAAVGGLVGWLTRDVIHTIQSNQERQAAQELEEKDERGR